MTSISPPKIHRPIYAGAEVVGVVGLAGCDVAVYASGARVGTGRISTLGWGPIRLDRPVNQGEVITATQSKQRHSSQPTWPTHAVTVEQVAAERLLGGEKFPPPNIQVPLYECQLGYGVSDVVEGVHVTGTVDNPPLSSTGQATPYGGAFIRVPSPTGLQVGQQVAATQSFPSLPFPVASDTSSKPAVEAAPPLDDAKYQPVVITDYDGDGVDDVSVGATALKICNTLAGATVRVYATDPQSGAEREFGRGVVAGGCSLLFTEPLTSLDIRAEQWLCEGRPKSPPSDTIHPKSSMAPVVLTEPICDGAVEVEVTGAELAATIEIEVTSPQGGFEPRGAATAVEKATEVPLDKGVALQAGQQVRARQSNATLTGPWSKIATVSGPGIRPEAAVLGGMTHPSLPGVPVFSRGVLGTSGFGPRFKAVLCGATGVVVRIIDPQGELTRKIALSETMEGHFSGGWDWTWPSWPSTKDIAIGKYRAKFIIQTATTTIERERTFFVAFDDDEIRQNIVKATATFVGVFPTSGQAWEKGKNLSEAQVNSFFTAGTPQVVDCRGAAFIIMARGVIATLSPGEFDAAGYTPSSMHLEARTAAHHSLLEVGDWAYIRNDPRYLDEDKHPHGGYQGENVIKVGADLLYGFPAGTKSYAEWVQTLISAYNSGLPSSEHITTIPGFVKDSVWSFDAVAVSIDIAKLRTP